MATSTHNQNSPIYTGRKTKTGNSEALRFEQALFRNHPEFSDRVVAQVIAPGRMLVLAEPQSYSGLDESDDPVIDAFLAFIAKDMSERLTEIEPTFLKRMETLVGHIKVDPNEDLSDEIILIEQCDR